MTAPRADTAAGSTNPLLAPWTAPFELPPFEAIKPEHFTPAFDAGLAEHPEALERG